MANPMKLIKVVKKAAAKKSASNANKRGLKAANKPVSKNNRNRLGDGEMSAYLKSIKPARPNRVRGGRGLVDVSKRKQQPVKKRNW